METEFPSMKDECYELETSESEFWKLGEIFFLMFCAQVVNFYCCYLIIVVTTIVRIN